MDRAVDHTQQSTALTKAKRTKRPRPRASSAELSEEDKDMAHCLILLAHGDRANLSAEPEACAAPADMKPGLDAFACKTCGKRFPSFQALGGHRTSHKKPRPAAGVLPVEEEERAESGGASVSKAEYGGGAGPRVHECSICGAEFASGQALCGHMRRHRPLADVRKEKAILELDLNLPAAREEGEVCEQAAAEAMGCSFAFFLASLVCCHY